MVVLQDIQMVRGFSLVLKTENKMYLCNIRSVLERSKHYFRKSHQDKEFNKKETNHQRAY